MSTPVFHARDFEDHEGEQFLVSGDGQPIELTLTLTSVRTWGPEASGGGRQPFTIALHGPAQPVWDQGMYRFRHGAMGSFDLFIVPLGPDERGMRYEAVFA